MKFTDWKAELEQFGYVVTEDQITTKRGDVLAGKDPYGGYYVNDSRVQDILAKKPSPVKKVVRKAKKAVETAAELTMVRARDENGHFIADDPETEVNEAWVVKTVKKAVQKK
jgi:hypothetical protein